MVLSETSLETLLGVSVGRDTASFSVLSTSAVILELFCATLCESQCVVGEFWLEPDSRSGTFQRNV